MMDVTWEYKDANDKTMEKSKKYAEWVQKYDDWVQRKYGADDAQNDSQKSDGKEVRQLSSKVYKRLRSVAVQTEGCVTAGTQTEERDFLMMAEPLSDSLVVECSESDSEDEEKKHVEHDSLF